jgi:prepilin-type N-terminal cleavage/methylation domain-containing protein
MAESPRRDGYTLVEVIVAILVFGVGVLALAASSGIAARAMAANATRERGGRIATSRIELIQSQCRAGSAEESPGQIHSQWLVAADNPSRMNIMETVTYPALNGPRTEIYRVAVWCP